MNRQGVTTTQKGCCSACDKPIVGQVITALGRTWHPEHFTCSHCCQELGTRNFFERDGHPYCECDPNQNLNKQTERKNHSRIPESPTTYARCIFFFFCLFWFCKILLIGEPDYHNLFSPRCAYCNGAILDKCVTALDKTWHTEHFFCAQCGQQFGEEGFHERDGKPYCKQRSTKKKFHNSNWIFFNRWTLICTFRSQRLLRYVCTKMLRLQSCHHGKLYLCIECSMACWLFRLSGMSTFFVYSLVFWLIYFRWQLSLLAKWHSLDLRQFNKPFDVWTTILAYI